MKIYLYDNGTCTYVCQARHVRTVVRTVRALAGVEYRVVLDDSLAGLAWPHMDCDNNIVEAPPHMVDEAYVARMQYIREHVAEVDDAVDAAALLREMAQEGLAVDRYGTTEGGHYGQAFFRGRRQPV